MKRGLFILNLTNEIEKKQNRNYIFEGGKYENKYQIEVLFKENDFDKVICFGTPQSSWDYLYNQMYIKFFNKEADKEDLEYLREIREVEIVKELFYKYFKDKIIIKYFDKDLKKNEMINYIYELKEEMLYSETIYIDITGGKRDLPIFIIQLLNLIINKENRKINVKIFYSKENENKEFEIISLDDIIEKLDYTNEISLFSKYGNPAKFIKHLIDEKLAEKLSSLYICTQYNLIKSIKTVMEEIKQMKKIYTVFIQEKVVETKINAWKEMLDRENLLINYQWQLSNFALAIVAKSENNQKKGIKNQEITDLRHNIVHAYDRKNLNYNEIEKVENSLRKENKVEEILVTNIGLARNYKKIKYKYDNHETDETYFAFSNILKYKKYSKVVLLGTCNEDWNTFIDKWIEENKLKYKRKNDFKNLINDKKIFSKKLNEELQNLNSESQNLNKNLQCILFINSYSEGERNSYFKEMYDALADNKSIKIVTYDMTNAYRDMSYINYINLHCLEILGFIKIKNIYYAELNSKGGSPGEIKNVNKINHVMNLFKSIDEFEKYNRYDEKMDINDELKMLIKKLVKLHNYNQINSLDGLKNEILKFNEEKLNNILERKVLQHIKETYLLNGQNKFEKSIKVIRNQLKFYNFGLALYLLSDLIYDGLIENPKEKTDYQELKELKKEFRKNELEKNYKELSDFYKKYEDTVLGKLRNEGAHINSKDLKRIDLEKIKEEIEDYIKKLELLYKNRRKYSNAFIEYYKKNKSNEI